MKTYSPRKNSQFSGAAAMFRQKEQELAAFATPGRGKVANEPKKSWKSKSGSLSSAPLIINSPGSQMAAANAYKRSAPPSPHEFNNYNAEPDIKIEVKSDIQKSINARKQKRTSRFPPPQKSVPEHIRKAQEREQRRLRAAEEREYRSASLVQAVILGWYVRTVKYPKLRAKYIKRRKKMMAVLTIQKTFRMYIERKKFIHEIEYIRRRERTIKEIKRMHKKIKMLPKKTREDIKGKRKQYDAKKKEMRNYVRKQIKEEDDKIDAMMKSGNEAKDMIKYMHDENEKVKLMLKTIDREQRVLEKQFEMLTAKSEEIATNFQSLQKWVDDKNEDVKKHEKADQKCRHRYLPKYREDLAVRNKHCITEFRIKELYKRNLKQIVEEVTATSRDPDLLKFVQKEMKLCKKILKEMPELPPPKGLEHRLKY